VYPEGGVEPTGGGGPGAGFGGYQDPNDEINNMNNEMGKGRANTLFQKDKSSKQAELKDFLIKSVIGRGSFGKVFLVMKV